MPLPLLLPALIAQSPAPALEKKEVEKPIQAYFRYHQTGDPKGLSEAFHPEALLQWSEGGERRVLTQADWIARAEAQAVKTAGQPRPEVRCQITSLEVSGNAAIAKVILDYPTFRFIDYLHLLRLKGEWKIVDKIFHREEGRH